MPWQTTFHRETGLVEARYAGMLSAEELDAALQAILALAAAEGSVRILADCRDLEGGHSLADLFLKAEGLLKIDIPPGFREAVVVRPGSPAVDGLRFWETVCQNRGLSVRLFPDREAAEAWLLA